MWSICDIKFQSIVLVFQVKLFATLARGNAASFYQSYATNGIQNIHHFHPIHPTQQNERNSPVHTYSLVVQTSTNYQPKPIC